MGEVVVLHLVSLIFWFWCFGCSSGDSKKLLGEHRHQTSRVNTGSVRRDVRQIGPRVVPPWFCEGTITDCLRLTFCLSSITSKLTDSQSSKAKFWLTNPSDPSGWVETMIRTCIGRSWEGLMNDFYTFSPSSEKLSMWLSKDQVLQKH